MPDSIDRFFEALPVIGKNWGKFIVAVPILGACIWGLLSWHYNGIIAQQKATIELVEKQRDNYQKQITGTPLKLQLQRLCEDLHEFANECDKATTNDQAYLVLQSGVFVVNAWENRFRPRIRGVLAQLDERGIHSPRQNGLGTAMNAKYVREVADEICPLSRS